MTRQYWPIWQVFLMEVMVNWLTIITIKNLK